MRFVPPRTAAGFRTALGFPLIAALMVVAGCSTTVPMGSAVDYRDASRDRSQQAPATGTYTVQRGDNIYGIARQLNVSVRALIDANNLQPPFQVSVGQVLMLPGGGNYVVVKDDTLLGVARKTGVSFSTLARINNLSAPYVLRVGQKLKLPGGGAGETAVAAVPSPAPASETARPVVAALPAPVPPPAPPPADKGSYNSLSERESKAASAAIPPPPPPPPPPQAAAQATQATQVAQASSQASSPSAPPASAAGAAAPAEQHAAATTQVAAATPAPLPPPPPSSGRGFVWPVHGTLLAEFGTTGKGQHNDGINIAVPRGTPVVAAQDGVVAYAGNELRGFGNLLLVKHADGWMTAYAHNDTLLVKRGDTVRRGQQIAKAGDSGGVAQPQVHFEVRQGTRAVDPMTFLGGKTVPAAASDSSDPG
ncbi:LysM peptidoglycan-binding domain-containing M23 family metallopeptidase [Telmatospirillum siberiense]|uniref:Peptidase M23 n=1 Tax=Telmatospirillum siberiense TaxID=382514 RepID=A0A2N3PTH0_9PROT|nr:LysM peptidoglycan-binding domain-containing M23 family metallopeptidase [Telmatospirillum siberiense]PKU23692.1 peptidase M23 [Telmatospirillum siberiense]